MRQTGGLVLFFLCLSIIFIEPVRDSLNNWFRRSELSEERALGTAIPYKQHIKEIQGTLQKSGFDPGVPDGNMGDKTRQAVRLFQEKRGLKPTGWIDARTLEAIENEARIHNELAKKELDRQVHAQFAAPEAVSARTSNNARPVAETSVSAVADGPDVVAQEKQIEQAKEASPVVQSAAPRQSGKPAYDSKQIQRALKKAGLYKGKVDGKIGKQTKKAIKAFQKKNKLKVDGVVGEKTWTALKKYL